MAENRHGIIPGMEATFGGIAWDVIQVGRDWAKCIAATCIAARAFDSKSRNDFAASDLREWLNSEFFRVLLTNGVPEEMFEPSIVSLVADDGLKSYGWDRARIRLISCNEYRDCRRYISWGADFWWTVTADSPRNDLVRVIVTDGSLHFKRAAEIGGVRPLCCLDTDLLEKYIDDPWIIE